MAVTGTGTIDDPFIVTTYDELVNTASATDVYVKVGNDINVTDEYPDGDMPSLEVKGILDGDGHTISNCYLDVNRNLLKTSYTSARIKNLNFKNIYSRASSSLVYAPNQASADTEYFITNCTFTGILYCPLHYSSSNNIRVFKDCSLNLKLYNTADVISKAGYSNCYIHFHCAKACYLFSTTSNMIKDCYIKVTADDDVKNTAQINSFAGFSNCVIDSYLTKTETASSSGPNISIINSTHSPNITLGTNSYIRLVDDTDWLNTGHLNSIGFNAG